MISTPVDGTALEAGRTIAEPMTTLRPAARCSPEFVITVWQKEGEAVSAVFRQIADDLAAREAEVLSLMIYGSVTARWEIERAMRDTLGPSHWPVTWIDGPGSQGNALAGVQAFAVSGQRVMRIRLGRKVVGSVFEDEGARYCLLGGLGPSSVALPAPAQVQQTLGNLEWSLEEAGFELADVVRTWFYNEEILAWYGAFNRVRSAHYANVRWRTGSLPASTGIGARNPAGAALTLAALAMRPLDAEARAREVGSPLQCPAPAYGSSFSRAMEIDSGGWRRLLVSGTASIFPAGATAWIGDPKKQVDQTMDVVSAILESRDMDYHAVTRATAYFKHPLYKAFFDVWCSARGLRRLPVVSLVAEVCRDDLLFEIELDACVSVSHDKFRAHLANGCGDGDAI